ncbi:MAG: AAA family ATPase [Bradymonadales bacterium]|nr:MAG: AAA family ATPase [Bradymonadales bacterium]
MSLATAARDIDILIRARYPIIYCSSFEEARVERLLEEVSIQRKAKLVAWTRTRGFVDSNEKSIEKIHSPEKALDFISEKEGRFCFLLKDFHPYLKDPGIIRKLRDLCRDLKLTQKNVILLSPCLNIPLELSKEMAVLDMPLPDRKEIEQIYKKIPAEVVSSDADELDACIEAALGLTEEEIENVFAKSVVSKGQVNVETILSEKRQLVQKSGILDFIPVQESFENIGGLENLKSWLVRRRGGFSQEARDIKLPCPRGILLTGIPGCGKSLTAVCTGAAWKLPVLRLDLGKVFSGLVGSSEENMRLAIKTAESVAPSILWIDEIEKGMAGGSSSGASDGGTGSRVFGTFLTWMQEKKKPVFVLATANDISGLPPEMLRKGRFDEIFFVDLPSESERLSILEIHLSKRSWTVEGFSTEEFLKLSEGFTGAEIEQTLIDARFDAFFRGDSLTMSGLKEAFSSTVPLSRSMSEKINALRAWAKDRAVLASGQRLTETKIQAVRALEIGGGL